MERFLARSLTYKQHIYTINSLAATIRKARPELLQDRPTDETQGGQPIPENAPPNYFKNAPGNAEVEDIGLPTTACFLTLSSVNPTDW